MDIVDISVRMDVKRLQRDISTFAQRQVPFATATTLTALARVVQVAEVQALEHELDRPTAFTLKSIGVKAATKQSLTATVYMKDIAASYLEPFEFGGRHKLPGAGKTWLNPKDGSQLNQYGNLPRNKLAQLAARADIFIGKVKTKSGEVIDGVWQRPVMRAASALPNGKRKIAARLNNTGALKLLVRFGDPLPVKQHLDYRARAQRIIAARFDTEFNKALAKAMASARQ